MTPAPLLCVYHNPAPLLCSAPQPTGQGQLQAGWAPQEEGQEASRQEAAPKKPASEHLLGIAATLALDCFAASLGPAMCCAVSRLSLHARTGVRAHTPRLLAGTRTRGWHGNPRTRRSLLLPPLCAHACCAGERRRPPPRRRPRPKKKAEGAAKPKKAKATPKKKPATPKAKKPATKKKPAAQKPAAKKTPPRRQVCRTKLPCKPQTAGLCGLFVAVLRQQSTGPLRLAALRAARISRPAAVCCTRGLLHWSLSIARAQLGTVTDATSDCLAPVYAAAAAAAGVKKAAPRRRLPPSPRPKHAAPQRALLLLPGRLLLVALELSPAGQDPNS